MVNTLSHYGFDGTTGKSNYGGRRTHIIQLLRDTREPLSVTEVAEDAGVHVNTARFHLESLVDAGLAERRQQPRSTPGRPKVLYVGILPNQTHERAQGFRLLAEILTSSYSQTCEQPIQALHNMGMAWGARLAALKTVEPLSEFEALKAVIAKLDALWYAPELVSADSHGILTNSYGERPSDLHGFDFRMRAGQQAIVLNHVPFGGYRHGHIAHVNALNAGLINGMLSELRTTVRVTTIMYITGKDHVVAPLISVDTHTWIPESIVVEALPVH
ncbi:helix-turn-helix transcriptional regulator [Timonella sp. A28]|uniref:helix-turn-helix transcriptional regulator n=1 Tax=Timonella sp. A28 TaxID=3442640 RepID=UPI003EBE3484